MNKESLLYGIDISAEMCRFAQQNVPSASIENIDFFGKQFSEQFDGIIMDAYIHLFEEDDVKKIFDKIRNMLAPK